MDLSSCLELRSSRCVASSASLSNGFTSWENNGRKDGIEKKSKSEEEERLITILTAQRGLERLYTP